MMAAPLISVFLISWELGLLLPLAKYFHTLELSASQEPKEKPSASRAKLVCTMVG